MEHKIVTGGYEFLPFARSCVTKLKKLGLPYADQSFEVNGASIKVRIEPGHEYIRIEGGVGGYEFLASDVGYTELTNGDIGIEGAQSELYPGSSFCTGSGVRYKKTPVFSQSLEDREVPARWPLVTIDDVLTTGKTSGSAAPGTFYTFASRPNNSFQTRHWWYNNTLARLVTSVCATGNGRTWVDWRGRLYSASLELTYRVDAESQYGPSRNRTSVLFTPATGVTTSKLNGGESKTLGGDITLLRSYVFLSNDPQFIYLKASPITKYSWTYNVSAPYYTFRPYVAEYDYSAAKRTIPALYYEGKDMFDVAPAAYTPGNILIAGAQRTPQANWRHAAVHVATDAEGGSHTFFVSTDTHGVFTFYPAKDYLADGFQVRDIPNELTKVVRVKYPPWVTVRPDDVSTTHDHWLWKFNKDATRACTTPLHQEDYYIYLLLYDIPSGAYGREVGVILPISAGGQTSGTLVPYGAILTPTRLKVFRRKDGSTYTAAELLDDNGGRGYQSGPSVYGVEYMGKIIPISFVGNIYKVYGFDSFVGMTRTEMEPEQLTMPGFVEARIWIDISVKDGMMEDFTPNVVVIDSEHYNDNSRLFIDCDYFVKTPKGAAPSIAEVGDLVTAEIEVFCGTGSIGSSDYSNLRQYGLEAVALGGLSLTDMYVFYTVRKRSDNAVVTRLALMRDGVFLYGCINERDYLPTAGLNGVANTANKACFYGVIEQADLRFLSFLTISYSRRAGLLPLPLVTAAQAGLSASESLPDTMVVDPIARTKIFPHLLRPRFELRVGGELTKTTDYSRPEVTGFGGAADPMADSTVPSGITDRSSDPDYAAACLAVKHYFARHHIRITNNDTFSFSPDGSWSVYADRRSADLAPRDEAPDLITAAMPISVESTEQNGVFDIVTPKAGKPTSHKDMFNGAFEQTREYSFYDQHTGDMGGFGRCGIWTGK